MTRHHDIRNFLYTGRGRGWILISTLALGVATAAAGCGGGDSGTGPAPKTATGGSLYHVPAAKLGHLKIVKVAKKSLVHPVVVPALVSFNDLKTSEVTPLVNGNVAKIFVHEGDKVKERQPLLTVASPDSSDNAANLSRDLSALHTAQAILTRDKDLYKHKAISLEELQHAQLDVASASASVQNDKTHMHITGSNSHEAMLRSPIAGVIVSRQVSVGDVVQADSTPCFTITDPSAVWIVSHLYQEDVRRVKVGDQAQIRSPVLDAPIEGKVTYIGASIDPDTLTIPVRIAARNPDGLLKKGMYVDAAILPAEAEQTVVVPAYAVLHDEDNLPFVYVQKSKGTFARRHVVLGDQIGDAYAVKKGLKGGEQVLADGALFVQFADSLQ